MHNSKYLDIVQSSVLNTMGNVHVEILKRRSTTTNYGHMNLRQSSCAGGRIKNANAT